MRKTIREQLDAGLVSLDLRLREHVGNITGFAEELEKLGKKDDLRNPDEIMAVYRRMREVEKLLDEYTERAARFYSTLETSADLAEHVRIIMGYESELLALSGDSPEVKARRAAIEKEIGDQVSYAALNPAVQETLRQIAALREDVGARCGLAKEIAALRSIPGEIGTLIRARGHKNGHDHYVQTLSQGLALFAMAFYGKPIVYRTTDFKTNEYRNLLGGNLFEDHEDNPMLGYRGVSRDIHDWEIESFKLARSAYGAHNLQLMLPFVRTLEQARAANPTYIVTGTITDVWLQEQSATRVQCTIKAKVALSNKKGVLYSENLSSTQERQFIPSASAIESLLSDTLKDLLVPAAKKIQSQIH